LAVKRYKIIGVKRYPNFVVKKEQNFDVKDFGFKKIQKFWCKNNWCKKYE